MALAFVGKRLLLNRSGLFASQKRNGYIVL